VAKQCLAGKDKTRLFVWVSVRTVQRTIFSNTGLMYPGQEERNRFTEVVELTKKMTRSEAERKKLAFISNLKLNSNEYKIPSSQTFAHAVKYYREIFAPRMLRASTFSVADGHLKTHLEADWNEIPIEHINIDSVNEREMHFPKSPFLRSKNRELENMENEAAA
jgi:hypothetical protein